MLSRLQRILESLLFIILITSLFSGSVFTPADETDRIRAFTRPVEFDYVGWTLAASGIKLAQAALDTPFYFAENSRHQVVRDYLKLIERILQTENKLNIIFTDPAIKDPQAVSAGLRIGLTVLVARQSQLAPIAEGILQDQIGAVVSELGLTTGGQPIPPILFHVSPLPYDLVVSPRNKIRQDASISLLPDLSVDRQTTMENNVDLALNVSSLVVPVGGIGSYPTMVMRTTALDWLVDTVSHEWIHNWLTLRPLGLNYETTPELRTMNETTASIAGHEIGLIVVNRYYPELLPQSAAPQTTRISLPDVPDRETPPFDFRLEMHTTRVWVDKLLAAGKIAEAEAYMEQRRQYFWDNGYAIRKLNQAYFAFYGAYADMPGGAAGEDPVGPAVRALREHSASLTEFLRRIARMTSFEELLAAVSK